MSSDISNYGGFGTQDPNAQSVSGTSNVQGGSTGTSGVSSQSSIQKSELEAIEALLAAGFPMLLPPNLTATNFRDLSDNGSVSGIGATASSDAYIKLASQIEQTKNDIINSMWDNFNKAVRELADRARKDDIRRWTEDADRAGPKSSTEYYAYLLSLSATQRAAESATSENSLAVQFNNTFNTWMVQPVANNSVSGVSSSQGYPDSSFISGCVACSSSDVVRGAIGAVSPSLGYQMSVSPVADALYATGPTSGLPVDYQAAAGLVAALLNGGAVYKATNDTIQQAASNGKPPQDLNFAINYAQNIMKIVTHNVEKGQPTNPQAKSQNQLIRLMLSTMALNMVYRAAFGGMSGKEFADLIAGNTQNLPAQVKPLLEQLVGYVKSFLPDNPVAYQSTLVNLMAYVDNKNSVDSMLNTTRMFSELLKTGDIDGQRAISTTG